MKSLTAFVAFAILPIVLSRHCLSYCPKFDGGACTGSQTEKECSTDVKFCVALVFIGNDSNTIRGCVKADSHFPQNCSQAGGSEVEWKRDRYWRHCCDKDLCNDLTNAKLPNPLETTTKGSGLYVPSTSIFVFLLMMSLFAKP